MCLRIYHISEWYCTKLPIASMVRGGEEQERECKRQTGTIWANILFIYLFNQYLNRDITFSIASLKRALQKQNLTIQSYT